MTTWQVLSSSDHSFTSYIRHNGTEPNKIVHLVQINSYNILFLYTFNMQIFIFIWILLYIPYWVGDVSKVRCTLCKGIESVDNSIQIVISP